MVQLQILSGRKAGAVFEASRLPITLGRSGQSDILLDDPGVWPAHCKILWEKEGLILEVDSQALASVNGHSIPRAVLRNGDTITLGGVTLRFSLGPVRQYSALAVEWLTWISLGALCLAQIWIIYWLTR